MIRHDIVTILKTNHEAPGWLSRLSIRLLISAQIVILESWDQAQCWALWGPWSLLGILSLSASPLLTCSLSLSLKINIKKINAWLLDMAVVSSFPLEKIVINISLDIIYIYLNVDITSAKFPETELLCRGPRSHQRHLINCQNVLQRLWPIWASSCSRRKCSSSPGLPNTRYWHEKSTNYWRA